MFKKTFQIIKSNKGDKFFDYLLYISIVVYILTLNLCSSVLARAGSVSFSICHKLMYLSYVTVMIKIAYDFLRAKFTYIESVIYFLLCLSALYMELAFGFGDLLVFYIYIIACINVDVDKFLKYALISLVFSLLFVTIIGSLPMFPQGKWLQTRHGIKRYRYGLGYNFTTYAPNFLLAIAFTMSFVFKSSILFKNTKKNVIYGLVILADIVIYIFTDTKSAFVCVILIVLLDLISSRKIVVDGFFRFIGKINILLFPLGAIFIFTLSKLYDKHYFIVDKLNSLFSGRVSLASDGLKNWGIPFLGTKTMMVAAGDNYNFIDSSYMNILFKNGIVTLIIVIVIFMVLSYISSKINDTCMILFLFVLAIHSVLDPQLILVVYNPVIAIAFYYINKHKGIFKRYV